MITYFWIRLIYLCGSAHPIIPYEGMKHHIYAVICWCIHYVLKIFHFSPRVIYRMFVKECTKYNHMKLKNYTSFGDGASLKYHAKYNEIFPIKEMKYEDISIQMMNNIDVHLKRTYGDYMQLPPKEQRINHAPYIIDFGEIQD